MFLGLAQPLSIHPHPACKLVIRGVFSQKRTAKMQLLDDKENEKDRFFHARLITRYLIEFLYDVGSSGSAVG
jgi:hypothetical protein